MPVLGIISHIKEEFTVIKERDPAIKFADGGIALSEFSGYVELQTCA